MTHTLHTCTSALFGELVNIYLEQHANSTTELLLKRVLTALVHHCDKPDQFTPISDVLVSLFTTAPLETCIRSMVPLTIIVGVRRGTRLTREAVPFVPVTFFYY